ncbi:hypothetical protein MUK42_13924 [Musa troglodytarum]|uniref:Uncharacterized protein n=1 Tax=Musa troglodytarum TaxID=320322 RepID=A0A9E7HW20_9LILI|nr:hypothetical protein MUK42_13924 [Musa troglodytarum]
MQQCGQVGIHQNLRNTSASTQQLGFGSDSAQNSGTSFLSLAKGNGNRVIFCACDAPKEAIKNTSVHLTADLFRSTATGAVLKTTRTFPAMSCVWWSSKVGDGCHAVAVA